MLVHEGAASFKLWSGGEAAVDTMFNKVKEMVKGRQG